MDVVGKMEGIRMLHLKNGGDMDVVGKMEGIWMLCEEWSGYGCSGGNGVDMDMGRIESIGLLWGE